MERYKKSEDRNQLSIQPMCLDDMISENAEVRALEVIVDKMDIRSLGFTHSETKATGRMPYDPVDMFKLYVYSYFNGIRSSRKIERECYRNIELMWLIGNLRPDFKTIADFRKDNKAQIKAAFQRFSMICCELGLVGKEIVAVDGSKFRASNGRLAYHTEKKLDEKIKHHTKVAEQYMKLLDACDKEETEQPKLSKEQIAEKIDKINKRLGELSALREEVKQNGTKYDTDPDSRMMKTNNHGVDICHNVQIAVDDKNHLVVAVDVTSQAVDKEQLHNIASQAKDNLRIDEMTVIADKGYYSAKQFEKCAKDNIVPIVTNANHSFHAVSSGYEKGNFTFDEEKNGYICPHGALLLPSKQRANRSDKWKDYVSYSNPAACRNCPQKENCTLGKYRTIQDKPSEQYAREVDKRTKANLEMYRKRKQLVEHPWGTVKRAFGFSYFLTHGTENVRTESLLHFLVYNMKRAINSVGMMELRNGI
jgi:transposase